MDVEWITRMNTPYKVYGVEIPRRTAPENGENQRTMYGD